MNDNLREIISTIGLYDRTFVGYTDTETFFIPIKDILYFETVDGNVFFYTKDSMYRSATRLYKLEDALFDTPFARISKTVIANLKKLKSIKKVENSRLIATLLNGEKLIVSRAYMSEIKKKLGV